MVEKEYVIHADDNTFEALASKTDNTAHVYFLAVHSALVLN